MIETLSLYHGTDANSARHLLEVGTPVDYHARTGSRVLARELVGMILDEIGMVDKEIWEIESALNQIRTETADVAAWDLWVRAIPSLLGARSGTLFDYGPLYVTPSFARARRYCTENPYRSEFLRSIAGGLEITRTIGTAVAQKAEALLDQHRACRAALEAPPAPVVIEFLGVSPDSLQTEAGGNDLSNDILFLNMPLEVGTDFQLSFRLQRFERQHVVAVHDL